MILTTVKQDLPVQSLVHGPGLILAASAKSRLRRVQVFGLLCLGMDGKMVQASTLRAYEGIVQW